MLLYVFLIVFFIIAVAMGSIIVPQILLIAYRKHLFDDVNARKVHKGIVPRLGGVSFVLVQFCLLALTFFFMYKLGVAAHIYRMSYLFSHFLLLMCGLILLFMVGLADDLVGVNYRWKFCVQIMAASLFPMGGLWINDLYGLAFITTIPAWIGMPLTVFLVVYITNAINLIDGIDGLCSGLAAVCCLTLGCLFAYNDVWLHSIFAFITAGVLCPFFYYNVFGKGKGKRRIFMGDTGSLTLGYSISFLVISYAMNNPIIKPFSEGAIVVAFSTLIVPLLDVARVVFVRFKNHQPLFLPDKNHIHHKFLAMGLTHHHAMMSIILMAVLFAIANIIGVEYISNNIVLLLDIVVWILLNMWFSRIVKRHTQNQDKV